MTDPEELEDLLADVPDLSVTEAERALDAARASETLDDLGAALEEADDSLRELLRDVKAMRRRGNKAQGLDARARKAKATETAKKAAAAKAAAAKAPKAKDETLETLLAAVEPMVVTPVEYAIVIAESVESLTDLDANLEEAELAICAVLTGLKPLRRRVEKAQEAEDGDDGDDDDGDDDDGDDDDDDDDD